MQTHWVTTNIRFPKELYDQLKEEAYKEKKSLSAVVRDKFQPKNKKGKSEKEVEQFMKKLREVAGETTRQNKGISLSQKLIEMRYEQ